MTYHIYFTGNPKPLHVTFTAEEWTLFERLLKSYDVSGNSDVFYHRGAWVGKRYIHFANLAYIEPEEGVKG